jgi:hypothetical protein
MGVSAHLLFDDSFLSFQEKVRLQFSPISGENVSKFRRFLEENILKFSPTLGVNIFQSFIKFLEKKSQNFSDSWKKMP